VLGLVIVLAWWPEDGWSAYAGLAFQSPSLLSLAWSLMVLAQALGLRKSASDQTPAPVLAWLLLCALGWLLVIDTLNLWPRAWDVGLYAWGFAAGSLWVSAVLVLALAWRYPGRWVWPVMLSLSMYALLRWPSGNLWDAWLDPVVWVIAHVQVIRAGWQVLQRAAGR
jgi:hypothetical protein